MYSRRISAFPHITKNLSKTFPRTLLWYNIGPKIEKNSVLDPLQKCIKKYHQKNAKILQNSIPEGSPRAYNLFSIFLLFRDLGPRWPQDTSPRGPKTWQDAPTTLPRRGEIDQESVPETPRSISKASWKRLGSLL